MLGVRISFFVPEASAVAWIEAALRDLKGKGHRFPNLSARTRPSVDRPWLLGW